MPINCTGPDARHDGRYLVRNAIWKDNPDLGALAGKPVRLRFVMRDADLYSIKFEETK